MIAAVRYALFWPPLIICTYLALTPSPPDSVAKLSDTVLHLAAFAYLTVALAFAHFRARVWPTWFWMFGYGVLIEVLQWFTGRTPEIKDLFMDAIGIGIGCASLIVLTRLRSQSIR